MAYLTFEQSADNAQPIETYTFGRDTDRWRYTSSINDVVTLDGTFRARAISRTAIETSAEKSRNNLVLTVPNDLEVADLYRVTPPTLAVSCIVHQRHANDPDNEAYVVWSGRVATVDFNGTTASITMEPLNVSLKRIGLRRLYQKQCSHVIYGSACGVNRESYRLDGVASQITGGTVEVVEIANRPGVNFAGGFVEWLAPEGTTERRFIESQAGNVLTLTGGTYRLSTGLPVKLYPGCDHTLLTCRTVFANHPNYSGFPYFPTKNPFAGDPLY